MVVTKITTVFVVIFVYITTTEAFTKFGRSCTDIGCPSNHGCIMVEEPCTPYNRNQCGSYPTCRRVSTAARTCSDYVCPPTQTCKMDRGTPKCFSEQSGGRAPYDPYPEVNSKTETTPRPPSSGGRGVPIESGYPGGYPSGGNNPNQGGGFPQQQYNFNNYPDRDQDSRRKSSHNDRRRKTKKNKSGSSSFFGRVGGSISSFGKDLVKSIG